MSEENKQVVCKYVEAFNRGDLEAVCETFAPGALVYGVLGWGEIARVKPIWRDLIECFQMQLHVESMIAEGAIVAVRYVERGTSVGSFRGGPVTGQRYEVVAMEWFVIQAGRIERRWGARDAAAIFGQMGLPLP
ncbi:MAG: ester cyclase [Candidatus Competibacteraceae bacterium]|nr:ester cyclase [Candidatus Competibacteraceae bacterium]